MLESEQLYREIEALRERLSLLSQASRRVLHRNAGAGPSSLNACLRFVMGPGLPVLPLPLARPVPGAGAGFVVGGLLCDSADQRLLGATHARLSVGLVLARLPEQCDADESAALAPAVGQRKLVGLGFAAGPLRGVPQEGHPAGLGNAS